MNLFRVVVVDNYNHFYGQGGHAEKGKCPLWSDNANLHRFEKSSFSSLTFLYGYDMERVWNVTSVPCTGMKWSRLWKPLRRRSIRPS